MKRVPLFVIGLALASPAFAADQFDLICTGKVRSMSGEQPIARHYHVDLAGNRSCYNECTIRPLAEVNNTQIVFEETKAAFPGDNNRSLDYVDRTTGRWTFFNSIWEGGGHCDTAPFSGFPAPPTKF